MAQNPNRPRQPQAKAQGPQQVQKVLEQASYMVIFSVPDPQSLSTPTPLIPGFSLLAYQIELVEAPRRLEIRTDPPDGLCGFRNRRSIGGQIADQTLLLQVAPNYFQCGAGRTPPPTLLNPLLSQRFWMSNGSFVFRDGEGSGFSAQAAGRLFPAGSLNLWVGGVGEILQGFGQLQGFIGNLVIAGFTKPPDQFENAFFFRFPDPSGALSAPALPPVKAEEPDPDGSDSALITLIADPLPGAAPEITPTPDGRQAFRMVERLRLADTNIAVGPGLLKSHTTVGPVVGERVSTLVFDPSDPLDTIAGFSTESEFRFCVGGRPFGTLRADLQEARLFRTASPELARPYFRLGGFGLLGEGTGQFVDLKGMVGVNGALSLDPWASSSLYLIRVLDPQGIFRRTWLEPEAP